MDDGAALGLVWAVGLTHGLIAGFAWGYWKGLPRGYYRRKRGLTLFGEPMEPPVDNSTP